MTDQGEVAICDWCHALENTSYDGVLYADGERTPIWTAPEGWHRIIRHGERLLACSSSCATALATTGRRPRQRRKT